MARTFVAASSQRLQYGAALVSSPPFTFATWVYPTTVTGDMTFLEVIDASSNVDFFRLMSRGSASVEAAQRSTAAPTGNIAANSSAGLTDSAWHHVCGVFTSLSSRTVYLNGGSAATNTDTGGAPAGLDLTVIGAHVPTSGATDFVNGRMAESAIWTAALTTAEVNSLALGVSPLLIRPASLLDYWHIFGNDSPELPAWGTAALTLSGSPAKSEGPRIILPVGAL